MLQLFRLTEFLHNHNIAFTSAEVLQMHVITIDANKLCLEHFNYLYLHQQFKYKADSLTKTFYK
jgi:hypothetical protein